MLDNAPGFLTNPPPEAVNLFCHDPGKARARILELEAMMNTAIAAGTAIDNADDLPLEHLFIPGGYARKLTITAGTLLVGKIHRFPCFNAVLTGDITVLTEDGVKRIQAPAFFRSEAGVKRVGLAHSDTVWITVHPSNETDLEKLEAEIIAPSYEDFARLQKEPLQCLG